MECFKYNYKILLVLYLKLLHTQLTELTRATNPPPFLHFILVGIKVHRLFGKREVTD